VSPGGEKSTMDSWLPYVCDNCGGQLYTFRSSYPVLRDVVRLPFVGVKRSNAES